MQYFKYIHKNVSGIRSRPHCRAAKVRSMEGEVQWDTDDICGKQLNGEFGSAALARGGFPS